MRTHRSRVLKLVWTTLFLGSVTALIAGSPEDEAARYLPRGAEFAREARVLPDGKTEMEPAIVAGIIARRGSRDLAFVYRTVGGLMLRVVTDGGGRHEEFEAQLPGTYVGGKESFPGLFLKDLTGVGLGQVFVQTAEGASAGSYLSVFALGRDGLHNLVGEGAIGAFDFDLDCAMSAPCRIVASGKWTDPSGAWIRVYAWNGATLSETADSGLYVSRRLAKVAAEASAAEPQPVAYRVHLAKLAATLYQTRHEYDKATDLCRNVLSKLDDQGNSVEPGGTQRPASLETDIRLGKADLHDLLGEVFDSAGRPSEAQAERRLAEDLRKAGADR